MASCRYLKYIEINNDTVVSALTHLVHLTCLWAGAMRLCLISLHASPPLTYSYPKYISLLNRAAHLQEKKSTSGSNQANKVNRRETLRR